MLAIWHIIFLRLKITEIDFENVSA
jgi:hypothetical protein